MPGNTTPAALVAALAAALVAFTPHAAQAHAILLDSTPAAGATVPAGTAVFQLRYNSRLDAGRSRVVLRHDGVDSVLPLDPPTRPDLLTGAAALTPGDYVLRWQVLSVDGHITRGTVPFTVAP